MKSSRKSTARLSEKEREELARLAQSKELREDLRRLREGTLGASGRKPILSLDEYIDFLDEINAFAGHPQRPFRRIEGEYFKI